MARRSSDTIIVRSSSAGPSPRHTRHDAAAATRRKSVASAGRSSPAPFKPRCECRTLIAHGAFGSWAVADGLCPLDWDAQHGALTQSARAAPPATTGRNPHRRRQCRRRPTPARTTNVQTSRTPTIPHIKRIGLIEPPNRPRPRREASRRATRSRDWRRTSTARIGGPSRFR